MKLSVSLRTRFPAGLAEEAARWIPERARAARDAGLDGLYVGDHHCTGPATAYFQNVPLLGRLLAEWDDRPFGGLFLLPLWNPVLLAEQVGTLASLSEGPFILQAAIGDTSRPQFPGLGVPTTGRVRRFEVGLGIVRRLLDGQQVTDDTGTFPVRDACLSPRPPRPVQYWIGATASAGIDRAARLGDGWECNAHVVPEEAAAQAAMYLEACRRYGRPTGVVAIRRDVHVAPSSTEAGWLADRAVAGGYRGFRREALVYGDVGGVTAQLRAYAHMGYTEVIVRHFADDQAAVLTSLRLLGEVRAALAERP
ncbi:MAG TPA: LLM class flavin-dependent oxidoreductase [Acidimicrobiales bacterium]|nr:LLM class flavin-dependent oxidoreductase [Acidimicrobiales bacterium]